MDLTELSLVELREKLRSGETTSVAATKAMLARIVDVDNAVKSYICVTDERALAQAAAADKRRADGDDSPLLGVPIGV